MIKNCAFLQSNPSSPICVSILYIKQNVKMVYTQIKITFNEYSLSSSANVTRLPVSSLRNVSLSSPISSRISLMLRSNLLAIKLTNDGYLFHDVMYHLFKIHILYTQLALTTLNVKIQFVSMNYSICLDRTYLRQLNILKQFFPPLAPKLVGILFKQNYVLEGRCSLTYGMSGAMWRWEVPQNSTVLLGLESWTHSYM